MAELIADTGSDSPSLLDVGSGRGEALHAAQEIGLTDVNPRSMTLLLGKHGLRPYRWLKRAQLTIPFDGGLRERAPAFGASQCHKLGNVTGLSTNMDVWARKL